MSDLISRSELTKDLMEQIPLAENVHIFRDIIDSQPIVSDKEIRDKAIDEFTEKMKDVAYQWFKCGTMAIGMIDEIAEQMKEVGK